MRRLGTSGVVIIFLTIVYIPIILSLGSWISGHELDIPLSGYTDAIEIPEFTWHNLCTGDFQNKYVNWLDANIKPRGAMIHLYNTLRYNLFNQASNPIADNGDVLEESYLHERCCIGMSNDYSLPDNKNNMETYVLELKEIQQKLSQHGKYLFVYIAPSKADWDYANIPQKYIRMKEDDSVRMSECFKTEISKTNIPFMDCDDLYPSLEYPAFYSTGIHWSRTFEQKASARIIEKLSELTGNKYRKILLGDVQRSTEPFWRDSDVFDNLNIWNRRNEIYYEYAELREQDDYCKLRMLMYGDSFGMGLAKDILNRYPLEDVYYVNYYNYIQTRNAEATMLNQDWKNMNFPYYLDRSDVVVIEMVKPNIGQYSCGFTKALNTALDSYVEGTTLQEHLTELNPSDKATAWNSEDVLGLYEKEDGFVWSQKNCQIILDSKSIKNDGGLEIEYSSPGQLQRQTVTVWINGKNVSIRTYEQETDDKIIILSEQLPDDVEGAYAIEIACSDSFIPSQRGESADDRELGIRIHYIGGMQE